MSLDISTVGYTTAPYEFKYDWKTVVLYALGIGAKKRRARVPVRRPRGPRSTRRFAVVPAYPRSGRRARSRPTATSRWSSTAGRRVRLHRADSIRGHAEDDREDHRHLRHEEDGAGRGGRHETKINGEAVLRHGVVDPIPRRRRLRRRPPPEGRRRRGPRRRGAHLELRGGDRARAGAALSTLGRLESAPRRPGLRRHGRLPARTDPARALHLRLRLSRSRQERLRRRRQQAQALHASSSASRCGRAKTIRPTPSHSRTARWRCKSSRAAATTGDQQRLGGDRLSHGEERQRRREEVRYRDQRATVGAQGRRQEGSTHR